MSTNERDDIGEDLPPDYISSVRSDGFYGWPWFYIGNHVDPRHKGKHPELADKVIVPDVLVEAHSAPLTCAFTPAISSLANTNATFSPRSTVRGIGRNAPATRLFAFPSTTQPGKHSVKTKIS